MNRPEEIALKYVGMTELPGNRFTDETSLGRMLKAAGQKDGESWCCYFCEGVMVEAFPQFEKILRKLFSANCVQTLKNFEKAGFPILPLPKVGTVMIMQRMVNGQPQTKGHAGIPYKLLNSWEFECIEGNSNDEGGREGYEVAHQPKRQTKKDVWNGLKIVGFIDIAAYIEEYAKKVS